MNIKKTEWDIGFACGVAWAVSFLMSWHEENHAVTVLRESGLTLNDFIKARVEPCDMKNIRKALKNI